MKMPTTTEIKALHRKYASTPEVLDLVFTHCQAVYDIAEQLITTKNLGVDIDLVHVGCLLHDIGVYTLFDEQGNERAELPYITHGIRGEAILKQENMPEEIWRIASHHTGSGISRQEIVSGDLPMPHQDFMADTPEEALVMYADKFHSKTNPPYFNDYEWYKAYLAQFGDANVARFVSMAENFGVPDLEELSVRYGHEIRRKAA